MTWDSLIHWAADVENLIFAFMWLVAIPLCAFLASFIWHSLRNNYRARIKARLPETNCECGGCAVLKRPKPIEGAHGAYEEPDHVREKREAFVIRRQKWARKQDLEAEIYSLIGDVKERGDQ